MVLVVYSINTVLFYKKERYKKIIKDNIYLKILKDVPWGHLLILVFREK